MLRAFGDQEEKDGTVKETEDNSLLSRKKNRRTWCPG